MTSRPSLTAHATSAGVPESSPTKEVGAVGEGGAVVAAVAAVAAVVVAVVVAVVAGKVYGREEELQN